jgi:hypothetical protein
MRRHQTKLTTPSTNRHLKVIGLSRHLAQLEDPQNMTKNEAETALLEIMENPWAILRMAVIWNLRCQKCEYGLTPKIP